MKSSTAIKIFSDRYPYIGPAVWILSIQYFINQFIVAGSWSIGYSLRINPISDLGNTACGLYSGRFVCSPLHSVMNASFIMLGVTMASGSLLIYQEFKESRESLVGFSFMALAGLGTLLVGLFPENGVTSLHVLGAVITFLLGSLSLIVLGFALRLPKALKVYTLSSGSLSLLAFLLLSGHRYLGLGAGGLERVVSYPQTIWLIVFGLYISTNHIKRLARKDKPVKN